MAKRRVVVTGLGLVTPIGMGVTESWKNAINGVSGITKITKFDSSNFASQVAGEVKEFDPSQFLPPKEIRIIDPYIK
jgi:3-oxoacyl-[acyl-carrier-protein] synthase II